MTYKELNERYHGVDNNETLLKLIEHDFGKEAADHLKCTGSLSLNEAIGYRNKLIEEALGISMSNYGHYGDIIGWIYNEPTGIDFEGIVLDFTNY